MLDDNKGGILYYKSSTITPTVNNKSETLLLAAHTTTTTITITTDVTEMPLQVFTVNTVVTTASLDLPITTVTMDNATIDGITVSKHKSYEELEFLGKKWQVVLVILYTLTTIFSLMGNTVAIVVLTTGRRSSKELRLFLVNLSMSDILMAMFSIPFTYTSFMLGRWVLAPWFCPIVQGMQMTSVFVSIYTLAVIGIDRYIAIVYPFFSNRSSRFCGQWTLAFIWILGFVLGWVQWKNTIAKPFLLMGELNYECKEIRSEEDSRSFTLFVFMVTFAFPVVVLVFTYGTVSTKMYRHETPGNADANRDKTQREARVKIIKMLTTIVVLFVICWLPLQLLNVFIYFARDFMVNITNSRIGLGAYVVITIAAHWLSMANSFMNPIIYCYMSENFRADLRTLLVKCIQRCSCLKCLLWCWPNDSSSRFSSENRLTYRSSQQQRFSNTRSTSTRTVTSQSRSISPGAQERVRFVCGNKKVNGCHQDRKKKSNTTQDMNASDNDMNTQCESKQILCQTGRKPSLLTGNGTSYKENTSSPKHLLTEICAKQNVLFMEHKANLSCDSDTFLVDPETVVAETVLDISATTTTTNNTNNSTSASSSSTSTMLAQQRHFWLANWSRKSSQTKPKPYGGCSGKLHSKAPLILPLSAVVPRIAVTHPRPLDSSRC